MEQKNVKHTELEKILRSKSRISEILNKQRKLNLRMIINLHSALNIPYEILAKDYKIVRQSEIKQIGLFFLLLL
jgi:HTH-type transcriptional regulator/antitoxin HigA